MATLTESVNRVRLPSLHTRCSRTVQVDRHWGVQSFAAFGCTPNPLAWWFAKHHDLVARTVTPVVRPLRDHVGLQLTQLEWKETEERRL